MATPEYSPFREIVSSSGPFHSVKYRILFAGIDFTIWTVLIVFFCQNYTLKMQILIVITFAAAVVFSVQSQSDSNFIFSRGPVPNPFLLHQHYPDRPESVECRPIRLHIERGSRRFVSELVTNEHTNVQFTNADARIMSSRLHRHLNELAETFYEAHNVWITVIKAWAEQGDTDVTDTNSLHYEGMCDYGGCVHQLKLQCVCLTMGYHLFQQSL